MPAVKYPCLQCKEKHVKCDEERPKCRRCQLKFLSCTRPSKKTVFRHGSMASFSKGQKWVNSEVRHFRFHANGGGSGPDIKSPGQLDTPRSWNETSTGTYENVDSDQMPPVDSASNSPQPRHTSMEDATKSPHLNGLEQHDSNMDEPQDRVSSFGPPLPPSDKNMHFPVSYQSHEDGSSSNYPDAYKPHMLTATNARDSQAIGRRFPLEDVQEACLLRYFVEEIAHWFDLCDESRHFQLVVPQRAHRHPHLLSAIFAVAARHLSRLPQYKTSQGILYHGQLLPNLSEHDAVEYMLKCIPALRHFHDVDDDEYRDSIIATAVILRQLEEIDDEEDGTDSHDYPTGYSSGQIPHTKQINFLSIINAVLRSSASQTLFGHRSLIQAAYWMALRQEIYHSFTRKQAPQLFPSSDLWQNASNANKTVMHTVQVAKWRWEDGSEEEWVRLMDQQEHLERDILDHFQPIFKRAADKSKGQIFPTIWYGSNIEVTSVQQSIMAKSVLVAENPFLRAQSALRANWRKAENDVRLLLLELCGIALCHPASPPALLHAAIGIQLYGDFFTDSYERQALRVIVEKYRDARAWPVKRLLDMFRE